MAMLELKNIIPEQMKFTALAYSRMEMRDG